VISLFLSDIASSINFEAILKTDQQSLGEIIVEELRGMNLVNFDEPYFFSMLSQACQGEGVNEGVVEMVKRKVCKLLISAQSIMEYFSGVLIFY
jgi:hypothetical protein